MFLSTRPLVPASGVESLSPAPTAPPLHRIDWLRADLSPFRLLPSSHTSEDFLEAPENITSFTPGAIWPRRTTTFFILPVAIRDESSVFGTREAGDALTRMRAGC